MPLTTWHGVSDTQTVVVIDWHFVRMSCTGVYSWMDVRCKSTSLKVYIVTVTVHTSSWPAGVSLAGSLVDDGGRPDALADSPRTPKTRATTQRGIALLQACARAHTLHSLHRHSPVHQLLPHHRLRHVAAGPQGCHLHLSDLLRPDLQPRRIRRGRGGEGEVTVRRACCAWSPRPPTYGASRHVPAVACPSFLCTTRGRWC